MKKICLFLFVLLLLASSAFAEEGMKMVSFSDAGLERETGGVSFADGVLTISSPGEYMLSGEMTNGRIAVECKEEGKVTLYLNGISIRSESVCAFLIGECKPKVVLSLVDQSENFISNAALMDPADGSEPDGALFSRSDLVIEGSGSLTVNALSADGIVSKDELEIRGGKITVEAKHHGIRGKDCVEIYDGDITVTSGRDGIKSTNKKDSSRGYIAIRGGTVSVCCGDDPLQFVTDCTIENAVVSFRMDKAE